MVPNEMIHLRILYWDSKLQFITNKFGDKIKLASIRSSYISDILELYGAALVDLCFRILSNLFL